MGAAKYMGTIFVRRLAGGASVVKGDFVSVNALAYGQQVVEQFDDEGLVVVESLDGLAVGRPFKSKVAVLQEVEA
jgi:hypothetical protein